MTQPGGHRLAIWLNACVIALGGFLMGFDVSVISGVVRMVESEFDLGKVELGWGVASLTLSATFAMFTAGPVSDRIGRRRTLQIAALLFGVSAVASALATSFAALVVARLIGGLGVGAALIIAPVFIGETAPATLRGRLVSVNQLNIVIGISAAFFSNYLLLQAAQSDASLVSSLGIDRWSWRWMLGVELLPALLYLFGLLFVDESPRWLVMRGREPEALRVLKRFNGPDVASTEFENIRAALRADREPRQSASFLELRAPALRGVLLVGITVAVLQQITGINAVFFYAPMIFEQSGFATDAAFMQAVLVGLVNLAFTLVAMAFIDRLGRRALLLFGLAGITVSMGVLSGTFSAATFVLSAADLESLDPALATTLSPLVGSEFGSDVALSAAMDSAVGGPLAPDVAAALLQAAIQVDAQAVLFCILAFVASFAVSLGPVMWVLFSEIFPNRVRAVAVSFVGLINSAVSFCVQLVFPWQLDQLGAATTFGLYAGFALIGLLLVARWVPETRGRSLEELEQALAH